MPKRTIAEARDALADYEPSLNDFSMREARQTLAAAEAKATSHATEYIAAREAEVTAIRTEALRELTEVRDALDDLVVEGKIGRTTAAEYQGRLKDLRTRQQRAEGALSKAGELVAIIEGIEVDPVAWFDDLVRRQPKLRLEFLW